MDNVQHTPGHQSFQSFVHWLEKQGQASDARRVTAEAKKVARAAVQAKIRENGKTNDKKLAAKYVIENADPSISNGEVAKIVAKELEITYANAYYYVTRVFKR
ncbi:hypothetical protein EBT25_15215 [bacterium]|nr:hypothetical protein [bacterium]